MSIDPAQAALVQRLRVVLAAEPTQREVAMFGGRAFMVEGAMVVSSRHGGTLLVRVAEARGAQLLERPGAAPAMMGAGREMGAGWVEIASASLADDAQLAIWVGEALAHLRSAASIP